MIVVDVWLCFFVFLFFSHNLLLAFVSISFLNKLSYLLGIYQNIHLFYSDDINKTELFFFFHSTDLPAQEPPLCCFKQEPFYLSLCSVPEYSILLEL